MKKHTCRTIVVKTERVHKDICYDTPATGENIPRVLTHRFTLRSPGYRTQGVEYSLIIFFVSLKYPPGWKALRLTLISGGSNHFLISLYYLVYIT